MFRDSHYQGGSEISVRTLHAIASQIPETHLIGSLSSSSPLRSSLLLLLWPLDSGAARPDGAALPPSPPSVRPIRIEVTQLETGLVIFFRTSPSSQTNLLSRPNLKSGLFSSASLCIPHRGTLFLRMGPRLGTLSPSAAAYTLSDLWP